MAFRVLLLGGGSGGHVYPLVAVAKSLRQKAQQQGVNLELMMLGDDGLMAEAAKEQDIIFKHILAGKLRRYFSPLMFLDIFKIPIGFIQALWYIYWFMPDVVFSKGSYDSVAPALAARFYLIPLYIHESDSVPGLANRFLSRFARKIFISFSGAEKYFPKNSTQLTGHPVRQELFNDGRDAAYTFFNLNPVKKTILILGGSQGAKQINDLVLNALVQLVSKYQVIHQCGQSQLQAVQAELDKILKEGEDAYANDVKTNYKLYPFFSAQELMHAYSASDAVVSRAGAGSLFEIAVAGKPSIIIPLHGSAGNHQFLNAVEFAKYGGIVLDGDNATTNLLLSQLESILEPERTAALSQQIKGFSAPKSADEIAETLLKH